MIQFYKQAEMISTRKGAPMNKNNDFHWFYFADGYRVCVRGFSRNELEREEAKHGKLVRMVVA